mgnify:CR=1 FL=1
MIKECDCKTCGNYAPRKKNNCRALNEIRYAPESCPCWMTVEKAKEVDRKAYIDFCAAQHRIVTPRIFLKQFSCIALDKDELDAVHREIVLRKEIELGLAAESALKNGR